MDYRIDNCGTVYEWNKANECWFYYSTILTITNDLKYLLANKNNCMLSKEEVKLCRRKVLDKNIDAQIKLITRCM